MHLYLYSLVVLHCFRRRTCRNRRVINRTVMHTQVDEAAAALEPAYCDTVVSEGLVGRHRCKWDEQMHRRRGEEMRVDGRSCRGLARGWDGGCGRRIVDRLLNFNVEMSAGPRPLLFERNHSMTLLTLTVDAGTGARWLCQVLEL